MFERRRRGRRLTALEGESATITTPLAGDDVEQRLAALEREVDRLSVDLAAPSEILVTNWRTYTESSGMVGASRSITFCVSYVVSGFPIERCGLGESGRWRSCWDEAVVGEPLPEVCR